jgi:transcription elongation factor SPT5
MISERNVDFKDDHGILQQIAAFSKDTIKSAVFVKAREKTQVSLACQNMPYTKWNAQDIKPVPIEEYDYILRPRPQFKPMEGDWVRLAKGTYQGDLALVSDVDTETGTCTVYYMPRLDLDALRQGGQGVDMSSTAESRRDRSPQAYFNPHVVMSARGERTVQVIDVEGQVYRHKGVLYKHGLREETNVSFKKLVQTTVTPTYEELLAFHKAGMLNLDQLGRTMKTLISHSYKEGARVMVYMGEQQGLTGRIKEQVDQYSTCIEFNNDAGYGTVVVPSKFVVAMKFDIGERVKVIHGDRMGEEGFVVEKSNEDVTILVSKTGETVPFQNMNNTVWQTNNPTITVYQTLQRGRTS